MCKNCTTKTQGVCDCCRLVDGDTRGKFVVYCEDCKAWICKDCEGKWLKRGAAYFAAKGERIVKFIEKLIS